MTDTANRSYRWLFWTLALLGLCLDQGSKYGVFAWLDKVPMHRAEVIADVFYLDADYTFERDPGDSWRSPLRTISSEMLPVVNHGALWGIGANLNSVFGVISLLAAIAIIAYSFRASTARDCWLCMALGLILAGTVGNLYDRVVFLGVRDFLHWVYQYNFPVFNIADSCLVCGAALLLIQAFFTVPKEEKAPAAATQTAAESTAAEPITQPEAVVAK
jgi:signal peptidase II